jgi:hypothetical protein
MEGPLKSFLSTVMRRVVGRRYHTVVLVSLALTGLALWAIVANWNINSDFRALLPSDAETTREMDAVDARVGSDAALFVVIDSPEMEKNKAFAGDLAERLRALDTVSLAHFHNDKTFYEKHQLLYLSQEELADLREHIRDEIRSAKKKANPLFVSLDDDSDEDPLAEEKVASASEGTHRRMKEYLASSDGYSLTMVVRFGRSSADLQATEDLLAQVRDTVDAVGPKTYHPEMSVDFGGGLVNRQETYNSILSDIQTSALFTLGGLILVIALYFRRFRAVSLVLTPLVMGVIWTLAVAFLVFGELTTISVFIFAILLGLGIDYSIHLLNGYDEQRSRGHDPVEALVRCYRGTGLATGIGAATTLATFAVISFANFRGLAQFGQVASLGVLFTLAAMVFVLPAMILSWHDLWPHERRLNPSSGPALLEGITTSRRTWPLLLAICGALSVGAAAGVPSVEFQENFRKIGEIAWPWSQPSLQQRQRQDATNAARSLAHHIEGRALKVRRAVEPDTFTPPREQTTTHQKYSSALSGQLSSVPTILLFDDTEQARKVSEFIRQERKEGRLDAFATIRSIYTFMPGSREVQEDRLAEIDKIDALLEREDLSVLGKKDRKRIADLRPKLDVQPFDVYQLPDWTKRLFREVGSDAHAPARGEPYAFEYMIYSVVKLDQMNGSEAREVVRQLERIRTETGVDFTIASKARVMVSMLEHIQGGGLRLILVAIGLVALLLMVTFQGPLRGLIAFLPFGIGGLWMLGVMGWLGIRLDFFNIIIIPVVIGIGVDDGVHFYRHYLEGGPGSVFETFRWVGAAVTMTSITSAIGFGGLALTDQNGLQSMGHLAITGIGCTWAATLIAMPAVLLAAEHFGWSRLTGSGERDSDV